MAKDEKLPYMRWYPSDLDAEPSLRLCSWEACWLWIKMLGLMHQSPQRGYLLKGNGTPYTETELASSIFGATPDRIKNCLFELEANAVFSRDRRGFIYCRKIVKGEKRAKNLSREKTKSRDKSEINRRKNGEIGDLALAGSDGDIKEISASGSRPLVNPESRVQNPDKKDSKQQQYPTDPLRAALSLGIEIGKLTGMDQSPNWFGDTPRIERWLNQGWEPDLDIIPTIRRIMARRAHPPNTLKFFEAAIADAHAERLTPLPQGNPHEPTDHSATIPRSNPRKIDPNDRERARIDATARIIENLIPD